MKTVLPGRIELAVFVVMAIAGGVLVALSSQRDTMIFVVTLPLFLVAALMGFRRSLKVRPSEVVVREDVNPGA